MVKGRKGKQAGETRLGGDTKESGYEAGSSCKEERRQFLEDRGIGNKEIEEGRSGEGDWFERAIKMKREK